MEETRKLYERFPGCEDTVFSYLLSLGMMIESLKKTGDLQEAERCVRQAEFVIDGTHRDNPRLRKEVLDELAQNREKSVAAVMAVVQTMESLLAAGMDIKVAELYSLAREFSGFHPGDAELACGRMEAGLHLLGAYERASSPRNAELLARELLDIADRFPGEATSIIVRAGALSALHRAHIDANECDLAEGVLEELPRLRRVHSDSMPVAKALAAAPHLQLLHYLHFGQASKF